MYVKNESKTTFAEIFPIKMLQIIANLERTKYDLHRSIAKCWNVNFWWRTL